MGMHMVKYGCDLLGPGTLESVLSQEYIDELGAIPCQIIQGMTPLPLIFCSFFHYL